jgi:hypothetical protein
MNPWPVGRMESIRERFQQRRKMGLCFFGPCLPGLYFSGLAPSAIGTLLESLIFLNWLQLFVRSFLRLHSWVSTHLRQGKGGGGHGGLFLTSSLCSSIQPFSGPLSRLDRIQPLNLGIGSACASLGSLFLFLYGF